MTKNQRIKKFLKIYPNIPLALRKTEIVAIVEDERLTFYDIWSAIIESTVVDEALEHMDKMRIL